jgi:hypothetical protein
METDDWQVLSQAEMRRRIQKYKGKKAYSRPKPGQKSTKIAIWDINLLIRLDNLKRLWDFVLGRKNFGRIVSKRLSRILLLLDAGRITKTQHGVYHFHDAPVVDPVREMRVSLGGAGVVLNKMQQDKAIPSMPDFSKVFEGR